MEQRQRSIPELTTEATDAVLEGRPTISLPAAYLPVVHLLDTARADVPTPSAPAEAAVIDQFRATRRRRRLLKARSATAAGVFSAAAIMGGGLAAAAGATHSSPPGLSHQIPVAAVAAPPAPPVKVVAPINVIAPRIQVRRPLIAPTHVAPLRAVEVRTAARPAAVLRADSVTHKARRNAEPAAPIDADSSQAASHRPDNARAVHITADSKPAHPVAHEPGRAPNGGLFPSHH